ncbi:MAG: hypothetical protein [Bacteriophage sp.]|nr:MAG: hypothetical protein [Bacteriophage sp.]
MRRLQRLAERVEGYARKLDVNYLGLKAEA